MKNKSMPQPKSITKTQPDSQPSNGLVSKQTGTSSKKCSVLKANPQNFPFPAKDNGSIPPILENYEYLFKQLGIRIWYDLIKKRMQIIIPDCKNTMDNQEAVKLHHLKNLCRRHGMSTSEVEGAIVWIGDKNSDNPVFQWIRSKEWDGVDRLDDFCNTITAADDFPEDLKRTLIIKWLHSAVAAALKEEGFSARGVLTLQGPQGIGKTSWFRALMPQNLTQEYILLDHHLDPSNKDSKMTAASHWIVEIGELDSSFKKDIARLKGYITSGFDKLRRPYGKADSEYSRRTVFCASVNQPDFLIDSTGNSRWWTIPAIKIDYNHGIDMQQVYAQIATEYYYQDKPWWLTSKEEALLDTHNRKHQASNSIRDRIVDKLDISLIEDPDLPKMSASQVLVELLGMKHPTNAQARECGSVLREFIGEPKKTRGVMKWPIPLKIDNPNPNHSSENIDDIDNIDDHTF